MIATDPDKDVPHWCGKQACKLPKVHFFGQCKAEAKQHRNTHLPAVDDVPVDGRGEADGEAAPAFEVAVVGALVLMTVVLTTPCVA